jgi:ribonuclease III
MSATAKIESVLGYTFGRRELLDQALTHRSAIGKRGANNEKLEFLGDAVLDLAVSHLLMERFPEADEGGLSKLRAGLVNAEVLAARASEMGLGAEIRLGKGEERSGGRKKESILAAAFEAVLGAVFLDGGFEAAERVVAGQFQTGLESGPRAAGADHKTRLQEITQRRYHETPLYRLVRSSGPDHDKAFEAEITIAGKLYGRGHGKTKKAAEQQAALATLEQLERE